MAFLSRKVFGYRRRLMRALMREHDLEGLAFLGGDFCQFATNFHTDVQTWERPIVVVVPRDGEPFAVLNELSVNHMRMAQARGTVWIRERNIVFYGEHPRVRNRMPLLADWPDLVAGEFRRHGLAKSRIGLDSGLGPMRGVAERLPHAKFVDVHGPVRSLRWVKHAEEIALMRKAAALADWLQDRYRENIRPGRLVQELDGTMAARMAEEGSRRFPGENLQITCRTSAGPASASPHGDGAPNGQRFAKGQVVVNIVIPRLNGMVVENERTWIVGKPSRKQAGLYETARQANEAAIDAAVTGNPVSAIDAAAQAVIEKAGFGDCIFHRTGHGMGLAGHEFPEDMAFSQRPLRTNEVYSAEPGIYVYGLGGFRIDDTVVVGPRPVVLTRSAKDLQSQTIL